MRAQLIAGALGGLLSLGLLPSPTAGASTRTLIAVSVNVGAENTCALTSLGGVACWSQSGDLREGASPTPVAGVTGASEVSVGPPLVACAVVTSGAVECWGVNGEGQLGPGFHGSVSYKAVRVTGLPPASSVSVGSEASCALLETGQVACWGTGVRGELGGTSPTGIVVVPGLSGAVAVSAGVNFACALLSDQTVDCWGDDYFGELGARSPVRPGLEASMSARPVPVKGLAGIVHISAGDGFACAVTAKERVLCWGNDGMGQLGTGGAGADSPMPVPVPHVTGAADVSTGDYFACADISNGTVRCWGNYSHGELGDGDLPPGDYSPAVVSDLTSAREVSAGGSSACALVASGIACWGQGLGQLGNGSTAEDSPAPVAVKGFSRSVAHPVLPGQPSTPPLAKPTSVEAAAAGWAEKMVSSPEGSSAGTEFWNACVHFVRLAYLGGAKYDIRRDVSIKIGVATYPSDVWPAISQGLVVDAPITDPSGKAEQPPVGSLVFWDSTGGGDAVSAVEDSHVAISIGGGWLVSTNVVGYTGIHKESMSEFAANSWNIYKGWWLPDR